MSFSDFRSRLIKSRHALTQGISQLFSGAELDEEHFDDLEDLLISSDVGVEASQRIVEGVKKTAKARGVSTLKELQTIIHGEMLGTLSACKAAPEIQGSPYVMLIVGVNGVGKTTSVAKIAKHFQKKGNSVLLAAADTFRAAAIEQIQTWAQRMDVPVIAQHHGADAAAVAHDALTSAKSRDTELLLIDTAGRQHTHSDLMEQLKKIKRVLSKVDENAPHEILQVLDATTGQNAVSQLKHFDQAVGVDSLCLTKLDGTAKGGVVVGIAHEFQLPIRFIGIGEGAEDLRPFDAKTFVDALLMVEV